jgi:hypothetical protein
MNTSSWKTARILALSMIAMLLASGLFYACQDTNTTATSPVITGLNCTSTTFSASAVSGTAYSGTAVVPYTGGNGASFQAGTAIASTGVTGLTATLQAGTLAKGDGNLTYTITGTPSASGTANFAISFGGQSCAFSLNVAATGGTQTAGMCSSSSPARVLAAVNAFKASLSASQISTVQLAYTSANAYKWSNLPASLSARTGLRLADLTAQQRTLALAIVQAATGTVANEGYDEVSQVIAADDVLGALQPNGYGNFQYYIAFYGTPAATGTWQLQFTGHHITHNITYKDGVVAGGTPMFAAVEPDTWTTSGTTFDPLGQEKAALRAMFSSLTTTQSATAKLSSAFGDIVLGPGKDKQFPTTKVGLAVSTLSDAQKALVLAAMRTYVQDLDAETAQCLMTTYQSELNGTFIAFSGNAGITAQNDYVRIDGPSIWIELFYAGGVIYRNQPHVHSIYRDRTRDYGGSF